MKQFIDTLWPQLFRDLTRIEFDELGKYAEALERGLDFEGKQFEKELAKQTVKMSEEGRHEYYESAADEFQQLQETFPRILRYSLFVHTYALMENRLLHVADHIQQAHKLPVSQRDLKGEGITRAREYLIKKAQLPFPDADWSTIQSLNQIRNVIVHATGRLADDHPKRKAIEQFVASWPDEMSFNGSWEIELTDAFPAKVIELYKRFLTAVIDGLDPTKAVHT